jgi:outer membrane immunogenic protein
MSVIGILHWGILMRRITLGIVGFVCVASAASAADLPMKAPAQVPVAPAYSWTGFYVGGDVGALWTRASGRWDPLPTVSNFGEYPISGDLNKNAFVGGLHAGYNWQFAPAWVAGIEGDWSWTDAKQSFAQPWTFIGVGFVNPAVRPGTATSMSIEPKWLATIRGRIGYLVVPNALLYFTGGGAWADVDYSASATNEPPSTYVASTSFSKTASGYVLGGGLEWALWSHQWSVRAEYLFYHLNTATSTVVPESTGNFPTNPSGFSWNNTEIQLVRVGASYKF